MTEPMNLNRFEELAMTHGPDLEVWPEPARADAAALLARSAEARAALDLVAETFRALEAEAAGPSAASDALMARILADAAASAKAPASARPAPRRGLDLGLFWRILPPTALAASALLGVALGYSAPETVDAAFATGEEEIWMETVNLAADPGLFGDAGEADEGEGL